VTGSLSANSASKKQVHFRRVLSGNGPARQSSYENDAAAPRSSVFLCTERVNAISMCQRLPRQVATIPAINSNPAEGASFPSCYLGGTGPSRESLIQVERLRIGHT
jgi:hypothetical protein